jgi:O-methyltransferase
MKQIIKAVRSVVNRVGVDVVRYRPSSDVMPPDFDELTIDIIRQVHPYTMTSKERVATLCDAVRHICAANIRGDIVECGVWRGGSMMAVAQVLRHCGDEERCLYLYDTYEGMTAPSTEDVDPFGVPAAHTHGKDGRSGSKEHVLWTPESVDGVRSALASTGYDMEKCLFVKGAVEKTIPSIAPDNIALLRLDTDWYESTRHELIHLFPRIVDGGILIIDDYGYWRGSRKAVDEYLSTISPKIYLHRIDDCGRLAVIRR